MCKVVTPGHTSEAAKVAKAGSAVRCVGPMVRLRLMVEYAVCRRFPGKEPILPLPPDEMAQYRARRGFDSASNPDLPTFGSEGAYVGSGGTYGAVGAIGSPADPEQLGASRATGAMRASTTARAGASASPVPADRRFRGAVTRTIAGTIVPGLGMLGTRAHNLGVLILSALVLGTIGVGFTIARNPALTAGSALQSGRMKGIAITLAVLGLVWVAIIAGTYLVSRPKRMTQTQRTVGAVLVSLMSLLVSVPMAVASAYSFETAKVSKGVFQSERQSQSQTRPTLAQRDPWADKPVVNLLLLGGDSGEGRDADLGVRTDTMMLVSIDTHTGATLIIQVPRNLQGAQFPAGSALAQRYPYGFDNGSSSMLNAVWNDVPSMNPDLFTATDYPGADALKIAFEGVTGLKVDYFVMVNIDGLVNLIDAMGGVSVNVNFPIAKGGSDEDGNCGEAGWIPEGPNQHLGGWDAMWYARSRCNSPNADFSRMQRQSCLVNAVIAQADPTTMATRYEAIAQAAGDMVSTDIPQEHLSAMVELSSRVQKAHNVKRITFVHGENGYYSDYPDFQLMHAQIAAALESMANPAPAQPPAEPAGPGEPGAAVDQPPAGGQLDPTSAPVENVTDACAYRHEEPLPGVWIPPTVPVYVPPPSEEAPR